MYAEQIKAQDAKAQSEKHREEVLVRRMAAAKKVIRPMLLGLRLGGYPLSPQAFSPDMRLGALVSRCAQLLEWIEHSNNNNNNNNKTPERVPATASPLGKTRNYRSSPAAAIPMKRTEQNRTARHSPSLSILWLNYIPPLRRLKTRLAKGRTLWQR